MGASGMAWRIARRLLILAAVTPILIPATRAGVPQVAGAPAEQYAWNLGIYYQLVPLGDAFGARLTRPPVATSPVIDLHLEAGDMITALDDQPIRDAAGVLNHFDRTTLVFVNIRTNRPEKGVAFVPLPVQLQAQARLRAHVADGLNRGVFTYKPPEMKVEDGVYKWKRPGTFYDLAEAPAARMQAEVEIVRRERPSPTQRAFWEPYLGRMERVIAIRMFSDPPSRDDPYAARFDAIYAEAMAASAATIGLRAEHVMAPGAARPYRVQLVSSNGGRINIVTRAQFLIATAVNRDPPFKTYSSGETVLLLGYFGYQVERGGTFRNVPTTFRDIRQDGRLVLQ